MKELLVEIENLQIELQSIKARLQDLRAKMTLIEADETIKITQLKDALTGQPIYLTDKLREAALIKNLALDLDYQTFEGKVKELERKRVVTAALLEKRRGEFKLAMLSKAEAIESAKSQNV